MDKSQSTIIKAVLTLLSNIYTYLKGLLTSGFAYLFKREPELELNKPSDSKSNGLKKKKFIENKRLICLEKFDRLDFREGVKC